MRIHPVKLDLPLPREPFVDFLLIQWRTPIEEEEGQNPTVLTESERRKEQILESLCNWIVSEQRDSHRPLFVLTPEVSTAMSAIARFERLVAAVHRPTIVIAGMQYMNPGEYRELISKSSNPERELWVQNVDANEKVNAAIILTRGADGSLGFYLQPKIHPADLERRGHVYGAAHVLLFHHKNHAPGAGVQFCVQICSDFCSEAHVSLLRKGIVESFENEDLRLDLTLLLECNPKQDVPQFRDGTNAYFARHPGQVRTDAGALVMLNNASGTSGKSTRWGDSQFRFPYNQWKQGGGEFTYSLAQKSGEQWQATIFRDSGPSVYWLKYKPQYLCEARPGSGDVLPFAEASCWKIGIHIDATPAFKPVSAVINWLEAEWSSRARVLAKSLAEQGVREGIAQRLSSAYSDNVAEWLGVLTNDVAKEAVKTLFVCFHTAGYPFGTTGYAEAEPLKWGENANAAGALSDMIFVHTLLSIGASGSGAAFIAAPLQGRHALLANSISTTYLWGGGEMMAEKMAEDYRSNLLSAEDRTSAKSFVIVLMNPRDRPDPDELARRLFEDRIDSAQAPAGAAEHLQQPGFVTEGETWKPVFVYDHFVAGALRENDTNNFERLVSEAVQGVVERAART